ncbi:MAG: hypothetical protein ACJ79K_07295 [Gemmatimonadaceae bacterium]
MTMTRAFWSGLRTACIAMIAVACHDPVEPLAPPIPEIQTFNAAIEEDWAKIDVEFSASGARGVRRVYIDSPERAVQLLDTTFAYAEPSVQHIFRLPVPEKLSETIWSTNDVPLRLVVEDDGGFQSLEARTHAHDAAPRAYGRVDRFDYNPFSLPGDTLRVSAGGNAYVPLGWVGMLVSEPISRADSVPAVNRFDGPLYMGSSGDARWTVVLEERWMQNGEFPDFAIGFMTRDIFGRYDEWRYAVGVRVIPGRRVPPGSRVRLPDGARTILTDERRGVAYVAWGSRPEIGVLDLATMHFRPPIALGGLPGWPVFSVSGDSLIVPNRSRPIVEFIDLVNGAHSAITIADSGHYETPRTPWTVSALANGHLLVTMGLTPDSFAWLDDVDLATGEQRRRTDVGENGLLGGSCARLAAFRGNRRAVVTWQDRTGRRASAIYDAASGLFVDERSFEGSCPGPVEPIGDGSRLLIGNQVIDRSTGNFQLLKTPYGAGDFPLPDSPSDLIGDGLTALIATDYGFAVARTSDGVIVDRILTPAPEIGLPVTPLQIRSLDGGNQALVFTTLEAIRLQLH